MRLFATVILCCLFMAGCGSSDKIPAGILPREKMQAVIWDMMRADQFLSSYVLGRDSTLDKDSTSIRAYQQVLALHDLRKEEFAKSFSYYKAHPELLKQIMDTLSRPGSLAPTERIIPDNRVPLDVEKLVEPDSVTIPKRTRPPVPVN